MVLKTPLRESPILLPLSMISRACLRLSTGQLKAVMTNFDDFCGGVTCVN